MYSFKVPDLNRKLEQMKSYFYNQTQNFSEKIRSYTDRFTDQDRRQFDQLLAEIKRDVMRKLENFIEDKISTKSVSFETHITTFQENTQNLKQQLQEYRNKLQEGSRRLKQKEYKKQILLDHVSVIYSRNVILRKIMRILKNYQKRKQQRRATKARMDQLYIHNLKKKSFFPWRTLCYKDGYENFIKRQTEKDIRSIHEQFGSIIDVLKQKIYETDEMIKVKKVAKGQFAYALSKNLLKTISNLSLQVMSLNQVTLKDREFDESATQNFMNQVDRVIKEKLEKVNQYKEALHEGSGLEKQKQKDKQKQNVTEDAQKKKPKNKKISFA